MIYSNLVNRLLDADAAVVVLNLLPNWVQTSDHSNNPIKTLVQRQSDRIVLVLPTSSATQPHPTEWRTYEYFLPATDKGKPLFPPQWILGFAEYEPEAKHPQSIRSTARQASLSGQFTLTHNLDRIQALDSAALLTLKKFKPHKQLLQTPQTPIQIHFWGATGTFPTLEAQSILSNSSSLREVRNKIVLVGFSETNNPDAFAIRSPFGELMPAVELQANLLASLLAGSFDQIVPIWLQKALIVLGGIFISQWIVFGKLDDRARRRYWYWIYPVYLKPPIKWIGRHQGGFVVVSKLERRKAFLEGVKHALDGKLEIPRELRYDIDLDEREMQVLMLLCRESLTDKAIAMRLNLSLKTIQNCVQRLKAKLSIDYLDENDTSTRVALCMEAVRRKLIVL